MTLSIGIATDVAIGVTIGALMENIAAAIRIGIALGIATPALQRLEAFPLRLILRAAA